MKFFRDYPCTNWISNPPVSVLVATLATALSPFLKGAPVPAISIWDTTSSFAADASIGDRTGWRRVPSDLLLLESDPLKASSDPAYYGREYVFSGDAVVENETVAAVFSAPKGRVIVYSKAPIPDSNLSHPLIPERIIAELVPSELQKQPATIRSVEIIRNGGDQAVLEVVFAGANGTDASAVFSFDKSEIIEIKPAQDMPSITILSSMEFGVVPDFIGDDLVFAPAAFPTNASIVAPSENFFVGLLEGQDRMLVLTWPEGNQKTTLEFGAGKDGNRLVQSIEFENDGQNLYLAPIAARGIWHKETLKPAYLEKDIQIAWKPPFPAEWVTQLSEARVNTTFAFRTAKSQIWRGVPGMYSYPVWFDEDIAYYRLSKKIPPKGDSIVYFLEGQNTPASISTPVDILKNTLGRRFSDAKLDAAGRKLRSHHRRGSNGVRRACTCGATESIQAIFEAGKECDEKGTIQEELNDMIYFVEKHVERIEEYQRFADRMLQFLQASRKTNPELSSFLASMELIAEQIPREYTVQKENMKSLEHADVLARQTMALTGRKDANNVHAYMDLFKAWRAMGGAQDYVLAQCHTLTRNLLQQAGYKSATQEAAVGIAGEVRRRCRECLRHPDGYEIWPNY